VVRLPGFSTRFAGFSQIRLGAKTEPLYQLFPVPSFIIHTEVAGLLLLPFVDGLFIEVLLLCDAFTARVFPGRACPKAKIDSPPPQAYAA